MATGIKRVLPTFEEDPKKAQEQIEKVEIKDEEAGKDCPNADVPY